MISVLQENFRRHFPIRVGTEFRPGFAGFFLQLTIDRPLGFFVFCDRLLTRIARFPRNFSPGGFTSSWPAGCLSGFYFAASALDHGKSS